ncbi:MAG: type II secretion system GspH family protein [Gammaproteobacteria bacterium]|nr:type II secretion system GspH family protein [Gammaproteobacteria bacterium]
MKKSAGFTLIEMSIVLIVISLILGGVIKTVGVQRQQLKRDETRQQLTVITEALLGFALTNGRLPCPDTGVDGREDFAGGAALATLIDCDDEEGLLPHVDIGVGNNDVWGNRFIYRVTGSGIESFADDVPSQVGTPQAAASSFSIDSTSPNPAIGNITINDMNGNSIALQVPAVVVSLGENGGRQMACGAALSLAEQQNCNGDTIFIDSFYSNQAGQQFDDLLVWLPLTVLKARMIEAELLP